MRTRVIEPSTEQILAYCAESPIERVFLEDVARRRQGRFVGVEDARRAAPRMLIVEQGAVTALWEAGRRKLGKAREDRLGQPVYVISEPPKPGNTGLRAARGSDLDLLVPACAR